MQRRSGRLPPRPPGPLRVLELCFGTASAMAAPLWGLHRRGVSPDGLLIPVFLFLLSWVWRWSWRVETTPAIHSTSPRRGLEHAQTDPPCEKVRRGLYSPGGGGRSSRGWRRSRRGRSRGGGRSSRGWRRSRRGRSGGGGRSSRGWRRSRRGRSGGGWRISRGWRNWRSGERERTNGERSSAQNRGQTRGMTTSAQWVARATRVRQSATLTGAVAKRPLIQAYGPTQPAGQSMRTADSCLIATLALEAGGDDYWDPRLRGRAVAIEARADQRWMTCTMVAISREGLFCLAEH